ncbi:unnamed protein product [Boreogadus saida]
MPIRWVPAGDCSPRPGSLENGAKHYSDRTPERAQNLAPDSLVTPRINDLEGCQQAGARQGDSGGQSMEEEVVGERGERIEEEGEFAAWSMPRINQNPIRRQTAKLDKINVDANEAVLTFPPDAVQTPPPQRVANHGAIKTHSAT